MCVADRNGDVKVLLYQGYSCCYAESRSHLDRDITENRFPSFAGYRPTLERGPRVGPSEFEFAGCLTVLFFAAWTFYAESTRSSENRQSFSETKTESFAIMTRPRQNFHADCEAAINNQINMELYASYVYLSMAFYFDRDDVAFKNIKKYFLKASEEEREHATKLMEYQNMRGEFIFSKTRYANLFLDSESAHPTCNRITGGRIILRSINKPAKDEWGNLAEAFSSALELEKQVNQSLLELHKLAGERNDPQVRIQRQVEQLLYERIYSLDHLGFSSTGSMDII
ncbi:ferritin heavy chain, oocyte isoform isoform X1 [Galendromus occidentalis]|uniref:Ferritin n=2 Tax=Galendromus occidentalis TaxID=34638 RepID=A0AAJ7L4W5_9ACAR|nr:ferritin heavy chain, oocyte isoform isoform X1 [Galendromus occidentalis]